MKQTWRWFGPVDQVTIDDICQAGATGIVSALHHIPTGAVWTLDEIQKRKDEIALKRDGSNSSIAWDVVESLPVSEDIKKQRGDWREHIENYKESLVNLKKSGLEVVCYNFMPVLDWTRTDLAWRLPHGGTCMRFDYIDFAAFDIHILARKNAEDDYEEIIKEEAQRCFIEMDDIDKQRLVRNIAFGLPGSTESLTLEDLRAHLDDYKHIDAEQLRRHQIDFLEAVIPTAKELGVRMCCHPDDPPFSLLGLPRIMSTEADYTNMIKAVDLPANGITLCAGSLGARADNDIPGMMERLGSRVHFIHLRSVARESEAMIGSFYEAEHLGGSMDMVALIAAILKEEAHRREVGRADHSIPMRPDHGQDIIDDLNRQAQPGYPVIGRLKGLAELRGIITALSHPKYAWQ